MNLTTKEQKAVSALKQLSKSWPESLWLFSGSSTLWIMKKDESGNKAMTGESFDPEYCVASIPIENDGGDW